jgi:3-oxoacyl-[acyl-carrier-protein] synthase-1
MKQVFLESHNITSPIGFSTEENFENLLIGKTGVKLHHNTSIDEDGFWASIFDFNQNATLADSIKSNIKTTRFEQLLIKSISEALTSSKVDSSAEDTVFIYSSTKGNIALLEENKDKSIDAENISLYHSAKLVNTYFNNSNEPIIVSNACISGVLAIIIAKRLLESSQYKNAIVVGADTISQFVFSGFKSFQALGSGICKPFSADRDGINLGEASACMILTTETAILKNEPQIKISGGAVSSDANHISGPSRTGEELSYAINKALKMANITPADISFVSAHGTATLFNDEMEAKAFTLSFLQDIPTNSLKAYYGHTLGASGLVEVIVAAISIIKGKIIPTKGFTTLGVPNHINICNTIIETEIQHALKTASGFGGCNASLVISKL